MVVMMLVLVVVMVEVDVRVGRRLRRSVRGLRLLQVGHVGRARAEHVRRARRGVGDGVRAGSSTGGHRPRERRGQD